jgi:glycyl-tRNA synthetase beta subunit
VRINLRDLIRDAILSALKSEAMRPNVEHISTKAPLLDWIMEIDRHYKTLVVADDVEEDLLYANQYASFVVVWQQHRREAIAFLEGREKGPSTASFMIERCVERAQDALLDFFADRLKVALKERGVRHDLIDALFSLGTENDLVRLVAKVEALQAFLKSDDGANLLAGYKRAANILKAEEKKDSKAFAGTVTEKLLSEPAEIALSATLVQAKGTIAQALAKEDFAAAMQQMAALRGPVDGFFDGVKVNADDSQVRENRLNLLASLRATLHQVADFSKIEG